MKVDSQRDVEKAAEDLKVQAIIRKWRGADLICDYLEYAYAPDRFHFIGKLRHADGSCIPWCIQLSPPSTTQLAWCIKLRRMNRERSQAAAFALLEREIGADLLRIAAQFESAVNNPELRRDAECRYHWSVVTASLRRIHEIEGPADEVFEHVASIAREQACAVVLDG